MMIGPLIVIAARILIPFAIFRWPFWGMLLAIAADASDVMILDALGWGFFDGANYHAGDKIFDAYYLAFAFFASLKWQETRLRKISAALFFWRLIGVAAFEITHIRQIMFFGPNIFENFYLIVAGLKQFFPHVRIATGKRLLAILAIAAIPKLIQEYIMHFLEFQTWAFFKTNLFWWLYM